MGIRRLSAYGHVPQASEGGGMNPYLNHLVEQLAGGCDGSIVGPLSTGECCYVALASNRYELLPAFYLDPVEAWFRLEPEWRLGVCERRGWPRSYAGCSV
jgi:hypothetical protein